MATNDNTKTAAYENYPANLLSRGSLAPTSVTGGTYVQSAPINVSDFEELTVEARLTVGAADGDMTVAVYPVDAAGNVMVLPLPVIQGQSAGPKYDAGSAAVSYWGLFDVSGQNAVVVRITNTTGAPKNISYNYILDDD